jgi:hypothetical protein
MVPKSGQDLRVTIKLSRWSAKTMTNARRPAAY